MSNYLIIYWKPKHGLEIQVRQTIEDAITCSQDTGGYIVQTVNIVAAPSPNTEQAEKKK